MKELLNVKQLTKSYGKKQVIHGIDFSIQQGEILCFLGPNGAAKSTTINILCGALSYDTGEILYKGLPIEKELQQFKEKLGIVPQDLALYEELTAEANVRFFASLYGLSGAKLNEAVNEALAAVGLLTHQKERVKTFSGGMKRRLNIACAIAHQPELLIMDEPTVGIDPQSRNHILNTIRDMQRNGMTILYTTHYMEEVEEISTRIIIMDHGKIIAEGTKKVLKESSTEKKITILLSDEIDLPLTVFYQIEGVKHVEIKDNHVCLTTIKGIENLDQIIAVVIQCEGKIQNVWIESDTLETIFLNLTGRSLRA